MTESDFVAANLENTFRRHLWGNGVSLAGVDVETGSVRYDCS